MNLKSISLLNSPESKSTKENQFYLVSELGISTDVEAESPRSKAEYVLFLVMVSQLRWVADRK